MVGVFCGEEGHGDLTVFEDGSEAGGLGGVIGVVADVEDEEGWDAFVGFDVRDGGEALVVFGCEAELFAVPELCLGLVMDAPAGFGGFDDGGDIVGVAVDGEAAEEMREGDAFGVEVGWVGAEEGGELGACGVSADEDAFGIAAELADIFSDPACGFSDVAGEGFHVHVGEESVVACDEYEAFGGEPIWFDADVRFVAGLPTATVDPEDDGFACVRFGSVVDIENVSGVALFDVGDVALDGLSGGGLCEE